MKQNLKVLLLVVLVQSCMCGRNAVTEQSVRTAPAGVVLEPEHAQQFYIALASDIRERWGQAWVHTYSKQDPQAVSKPHEQV